MRYLILILAISQCISPLFLQFEQNRPNDPVIIPANYTFAIWGLITTACLIYAVLQILPSKRKIKIYDKIAPPIALVYTGFSAWLLAAGQNALWATVGIFIGMHICLLWVQSIIHKDGLKQLTSFEKTIISLSTLTYLGWSSVAIFANLASALGYFGWPAQEIGWQIQILILALLNVVGTIFYIRGKIIYLLTIIWAFVGISIKNYGSAIEDSEYLLVLCLGGIAISTLCTAGIKSLKRSIKENSRFRY